MPRVRVIVFGVVAIAMLGSLAITGSMVWYVRSDAYRIASETALSESVGLPSDIGGVVPRSLRSRQFDDIVVWLPQRRGRALTCRAALLTYTPSAADPDAYEIQLTGGQCEISTRTWLRNDYRGVFESGLRPGFSPDGPRLVSFGDMDLVFDRGDFTLRLAEARGEVRFESLQRGTATIICRDFNGYRTTEPVRLSAVFSPRMDGMRVDSLDLTVPRIPVSAARLGPLVGTDVSSGQFSGKLAYSEDDAGRTLVVSGECSHLDLSELTRGRTPRPWSGRCPQIALQELCVENGAPTRIRFSGRLAAVGVGDILETFGFSGVGGTAALEVGAAEFDLEGIRRLVCSGSCRDISLEALTAAIGWGTMTGTLRITIDDLTIEHNRLRSLDATFRVLDAGDTPNWIEGALLRELVRRAFNFDLPPFLPERIDYSRFGATLRVDDEQLIVFGTHGEDGRTILTVRLFGEDFELVREPRRSFDLRPVLDALRTRARTAWETRRPDPSTP